MIKMHISEHREALKQQGVPIEQVKFICPRCKTEQSAEDLIQAGAGETFEDVTKYLAFSCVGRWDDQKGCNWTLGGLFQIHELVVITEEGVEVPQFRPVNIPPEPEPSPEEERLR